MFQRSICSNPMSVQLVHAEEVSAPAAIPSRDSWFLQIPPKYPGDNPDGTSALQTAETFLPQICVIRLQAIFLSDNFSSYREIKPGGVSAVSNASTYIYFLIC